MFYLPYVGVIGLKVDPILRAFLNITISNVFQVNSLDVFTLFVNQNMGFFVDETASPKC